jgi:hypothetical protein
VPTEFQNFWTIIKRVIAKMVSVGPPCIAVAAHGNFSFISVFCLCSKFPAVVLLSCVNSLIVVSKVK